jgi:hypothetical protein
MRCGNADSELHRFARKCTVEHGFKYNADLERIILDTDYDRQLQHNGKYHSMPFQMQNQLQLEQLDFYL